MAEITRELKRQIGATLIKLKKKEQPLSEDESRYAKILEGKGLVKYEGPAPRRGAIPLLEFNTHLQELASARYVLTGLGEEIVLKYGEPSIGAGRFLLPGESQWYDRWPWKLLWPAIVSIATTLIVTAIRGFGTK